MTSKPATFSTVREAVIVYLGMIKSKTKKEVFEWGGDQCET